MAGWLSEFLEQELNPVDVFLDIDADENSDDLFPDDLFHDDSDDSWDIPETSADSDAAPMALTDSETEWASDNASAFRPATPSCPDSDDEAPSRQPPATHDDEDEAPAKRFCAAIPTRRVKDKTTPITGLSAAEMRTLESFCLPRAFYLVLALLGCLDAAVKRDLLGVEYYSGRGWLTSAFQMVGDRCFAI